MKRFNTNTTILDNLKESTTNNLVLNKVYLGFVKLAEAEVALMKTVLPEDEHIYRKVFDLMVNMPLDTIKQDSEKFVKHCKECKGKECKGLFCRKFMENFLEKSI